MKQHNAAGAACLLICLSVSHLTISLIMQQFLGHFGSDLLTSMSVSLFDWSTGKIGMLK